MKRLDSGLNQESRRVDELSEKAAWLVIYAALVGWSCVIIRGFLAF